MDSRLVICGLWIALVTVLYSLNWHPWALVLRTLPSVPADVLAALIKLGTDGRGDLAALALGLLAALGAGTLLLRRLVPAFAPGGSYTFSLPLGLCVLAYLTFFLGLLQGYTRHGAILATAVVGFLAILGALEVVRAARRFSPPERGGAIRTLFFACWTIAGIFLLAKALRPAVFYDAIAYHLGVPNYYLQEGGIRYIPFDAASNYPFLTEMLYTLALFLHGLRAAQLTSVAIFLLLALAVRDFCREFVAEIDPHLPALVFLLTPAFFEVSILYTNDLLLTLYLFLVLRSILLWRERRADSFIILAGVFAGLALGVKYTALLYLPVIVVLGLWPEKATGTNKWPPAVRGAFLLTVVALLVDAPWLLKNIIATGNPVYPFFYGLFGGSDMDSRQYLNLVDLSGTRNSLSNLWVHPWTMFFSAPDTVNVRYGAAFCLGPLIVLLVPPLLILGTIPPVAKKLLLLTGAFYVLWVVTTPEMRYLLPAVFFLSVPLALSANKVVAATPAGFGVAAGALIVFFLLFNLGFGFRQVDKWTSAEGFNHLWEADGEYLARRMRERGGSALAAYLVEDLANKNLAADANVLIIGDAQHLYIKRRHQYSYLSASTPYRVFAHGASGNEEIATHLRRQGVTHIIFNPGELLRLQDDGIIAFPPEGNPVIEAFLRSPAVRLLASTDVNRWPVYLFELAPD